MVNVLYAECFSTTYIAETRSGDRFSQTDFMKESEENVPAFFFWNTSISIEHHNKILFVL